MNLKTIQTIILQNQKRLTEKQDIVPRELTLESIPKKGFFVKKVEADRFKALRESLKEILKQGYSKEDIKKELEGLENDCD